MAIRFARIAGQRSKCIWNRTRRYWKQKKRAGVRASNDVGARAIRYEGLLTSIQSQNSGISRRTVNDLVDCLLPMSGNDKLGKQQVRRAFSRSRAEASGGGDIAAGGCLAPPRSLKGNRERFSFWSRRWTGKLRVVSVLQLPALDGDEV